MWSRGSGKDAKRQEIGLGSFKGCGHLKSILPSPDKRSHKHHKAMDFEQVPAFVSKLREMSNLSALALEFCILTATRTSETLKAELSEFDLDAGLWVIPAHRTKSAREHHLPLSSRVLEIVTKQIESCTGNLLFPGNNPGKSLSSTAMAMMLRRLEVDCTVHGFRSSFRDWVGESTNYPREVAEQALAHVITDSTERAYRRGDALEKRRALMQS